VLALGEKVPADPKGAHDAEERGCAIGSSSACMELGAEGEAAQDAAAAGRGFARACAIGDGEGCFELANLRLQGVIEPRGDAAALDAAREACRLRDRAGCIALLARGETPPVPAQELPSLRAEGCRAGAQALCDAH
jgi:TPR repeat protein